MHHLRFLWILACTLGLVLAIGCEVEGDDDDDGEAEDTDGDGLSDADEADFGTDPTMEDTDGDGLTDLEEFDLGSDGTAWDSDGDTYGDYDEVVEGTDPTDPESRIYTGYWPYNAAKGDIEGEPIASMSRVSEGEVFGHFIGPDQYNDEVDLYDFAGQGKYTVIDVSTVWCGYCVEMAKYLAGDESFYDGYDETLSELPGLVSDGKLQWVTFLSQDGAGDEPTQSDCENWDADYPNEKVAVIADLEQDAPGHINLLGYPSMALVDENMVLVKYDNEDYFATLEMAIELSR